MSLLISSISKNIMAINGIAGTLYRTKAPTTGVVNPVRTKTIIENDIEKYIRLSNL